MGIKPNERRLKTMKKIVKQGALILALLGSAAFLTGPAVANSLHDEGDFGGGYRIIGPSGGPERPPVLLWAGLLLRIWPELGLLRL
jgi:hypothetical protein